MKKLLCNLFILLLITGWSAFAADDEIVRTNDIPQDVSDFVNLNIDDILHMSDYMNNQAKSGDKATWGGGFHSYAINQTYEEMMNIGSDDFLELANMDTGWLFYSSRGGKPGPLFSVNYVKDRLEFTFIGGDSGPYIEALNAMINAHGKDRSYVVAASGNCIVDITDKKQTFLLTTGSKYDKIVFPISELISDYKEMFKQQKEDREKYEQEYRKEHNLPDDAVVPITSGGFGKYTLAQFVPSSPDVSEANQLKKVRMLVVFGAMTLLLGVSTVYFYTKKKRDLSE